MLKEVDAKAWALEDQLLRLLVCANESEPPVGGCPDLPAPIVGGVFREDFLPRVGFLFFSPSAVFLLLLLVCFANCAVSFFFSGIGIAIS